MGGVMPVDWPAQCAGFDDNGLALILIALPAGTARTAARLLARQVLRETLSQLLAQPAATLMLNECPHGPVLEGAAHNIQISVSYAADRCLLGLGKGCRLGVDIVRIEALPETTALARLYLPATACHEIMTAAPAARAACFALRWAQMEARSKCLGLPLAEISRQREQTLNECRLMDCVQTEGYRIALATRVL